MEGENCRFYKRGYCNLSFAKHFVVIIEDRVKITIKAGGPTGVDSFVSQVSKDNKLQCVVTGDVPCSGYQEPARRRSVAY